MTISIQGGGGCLVGPVNVTVDCLYCQHYESPIVSIFDLTIGTIQNKIENMRYDWKCKNRD